LKKPLILALELVGPIITLGRGGLWDSRVEPEARRLLREIEKHCYILIHSVLVSDDHNQPDPVEQATQVERYLRAMGVPFDSTWNRPGKPAADHYVETLDDLRLVHKEVLQSLPPVEDPAGVQPDSGPVQAVPGENVPQSPVGVQKKMAAGRNTTR